MRTLCKNIILRQKAEADSKARDEANAKKSPRDLANKSSADQRVEIAAMYKGEPQNDIGILSDVIDNCTKSDGMKMLIRSMSPEVIVCDEIGSKQDIEAINYAMCSGVKGIFTAHGNSLEEIKLNEQIKELLEKYIVQIIIILDDKKRGKIKNIYKLENKSYIKVLN